MGAILAFPADAAQRRNAQREATAADAMGRIVILPVIRIERFEDAPSGGQGPEEGTASGRRRRRRARS